MKEIWKFPLKADESAISMPRGAEVIHAGLQSDVMHVWAIVDPLAPRIARRINVSGTGWQREWLRADAHIGTVHDGVFVWHIFDLGEITEASP